MTTQLAVLTGLAVLALLSAGGWLLRRSRMVPWTRTPTPQHRARQIPTAIDADAAARSLASTRMADDLVRRMQSLAFPDGSPEAEAADLHQGQVGVMAAAVTMLERIEHEPRYTPRRPQLLPRLMQAANDQVSSHQAIADIIAQDPALAGNLLRIANSAMYRVQAKPLESIERALARIGTDGIRMMIAAALVQPVMNTDDGVFGLFPALAWEHTLLSSKAASEYARRVERSDPFAAQLLGLLQGLASIIVLRVLRDEYARQPQLEPDAGIALGLLDTWTLPTAQRISDGWGLGDTLGETLRALGDGSPNAACSDPLARSLRFGRATGALAMLRRHHVIGESEALAALEVMEPDCEAAGHIWMGLRAPGDGLPSD